MTLKKKTKNRLNWQTGLKIWKENPWQNFGAGEGAKMQRYWGTDLGKPKSSWNMEKKNRPLTGKITIKNNNKALKINHAIKAEKKKKRIKWSGEGSWQCLPATPQSLWLGAGFCQVYAQTRNYCYFSFCLFVLVGWLSLLFWFGVRFVRFLFFFPCVCVWRARRGEPAWIVAQVIRECPAQCNYSLTVTGFISLGIWKCLGFRVGLKGSPKASFPLIKVQNLCQTSQSRVQLPPYPQYISTC